MPPTYPITRVAFDADDFAAIQEPLRSGWVVQGPQVARFEQDFAAWCGAPHAVATTSCTTAMHLALATLGVGPGDDVLVPAYTWVSTATVVEHLGARPVFVDVDLATYNIDPALLEERRTERTVGIMPVHLFGQPAAMDAIMAFAARHGLWVLEDAACGFDSWLDDRHVGTFGDFGAFSFHPRKSITTGEGGMLLAAAPAHAERARTLREHGASRTDHARHSGTDAFLLARYEHAGFNFRMTDLQGALGVAQLRKAGPMMSARREVAGWYDALLSEVPWLVPPHRDTRVRHGQQAYVCLFRPEPVTLANVDTLHEQRNAVMRALEREGIATRQGTHAAAHLDVFAAKYGIRHADFPVAWFADRCTLALPLYPGMTREDCEHIVARLLAHGPVPVAP